MLEKFSLSLLCEELSDSIIRLFMWFFFYQSVILAVSGIEYRNFFFYKFKLLMKTNLFIQNVKFFFSMKLQKANCQ